MLLIFVSPDWSLDRLMFFFFSSRRRHTRCSRDWSSDVCSSDLYDGTPSLCAPPRLYNQITIHIADQMGSNAMELARLLALVNVAMADAGTAIWERSEEHTSELQSRLHLVCRLLLEKQNITHIRT